MSTVPKESARSVVFVSHANPEDNAFTLWIALQLANQGFAVWSDVTRLLGGEDFWRDIEGTIRARTAKFLFVLSQASKNKDNPRKELQVALSTAKTNSLRDFIIPLRVDDIPFEDVNIQLVLTNAVDFSRGWAQGLKQLLAKFSEDTVPTSERFTPSAVAKWWESQYLGDRCVVHRPEEYVANWFPIASMPSGIYFHKLRKEIGTAPLPWPGILHSGYLVSFAPRNDFGAALSGFMERAGSRSFSMKEFLHGEVGTDIIRRSEVRSLVVQLMRLAWEGTAESLGLAAHDLSNGRCFYVPNGFAPKNQVCFTRPDGKQIRRNIAGRRSHKRVDGSVVTTYWHFGLQARPMLYPEPAYAMRTHVLFSDDGRTVWGSNRRLHSARRSHCRMWWNSRWRDCLMAAMAWMADAEGRITLRTSKTSPLQVSSTPLAFTSPVSYVEPKLAELIQMAEQDVPDERGDDADEAADLDT